MNLKKDQLSPQLAEPQKRTASEWAIDLTFAAGLGLLIGPNIVSDWLYVPESMEEMIQPAGAVLILRALLMSSILRREGEL